MQHGRAPPQRDMRQESHHRAPDEALAAAVSAPVVGVDRAAGQDRAVGFDALAGDFQPEAVETAETSQIRAREGSVGHVEVFQMGSVRTSIFGGPRPLQPAATPQPRTALPTPSIVKSQISPERIAIAPTRRSEWGRRVGSRSLSGLLWLSVHEPPPEEHRGSGSQICGDPLESPSIHETVL